MFPPFVTTDRVLNIFSLDLCRSLRLIYERESSVKDIPTYRFVIPNDLLDDPRDNEDNMCYCTQQGKEGENCPHTGAYQINACRKGWNR